MLLPCCVQWFKDTKLKANHNYVGGVQMDEKLCPMVQRY